MRDLMVKLYVDKDEQDIIWRLARDNGTNVNRYLRDLIYDAAVDSGVPHEQAKVFQRVYTERGAK
jgi:hypothetical protein